MFASKQRRVKNANASFSTFRHASNNTNGNASNGVFHFSGSGEGERQPRVSMYSRFLACVAVAIVTVYAVSTFFLGDLSAKLETFATHTQSSTEAGFTTTQTTKASSSFLGDLKDETQKKETMLHAYAKSAITKVNPFTLGNNGVHCGSEKENYEMAGGVVSAGWNKHTTSATECSQLCKKTHENSLGVVDNVCNVWVFCESPRGCGANKFGECWLKRQEIRFGGDELTGFNSSGWKSGTCLDENEIMTLGKNKNIIEETRAKRRDDAANSKVFFDVAIKGVKIGRILMTLYTNISPRASENMRGMCAGDYGLDKKTHKPLNYKNCYFYRIIDSFIDQTGNNEVSSVFGGEFDDDEEGLKLKHDRAGLLSAANHGHNTNSGHFSILVNPAPHLNGDYTIFGEVIEGMDVVMTINKLAKGKKDNTASREEEVVIIDCGQILANNTIISPS